MELKDEGNVIIGTWILDGINFEFSDLFPVYCPWFAIVDRDHGTDGAMDKGGIIMVYAGSEEIEVKR